MNWDYNNVDVATYRQDNSINLIKTYYKLGSLFYYIDRHHQIKFNYLLEVIGYDSHCLISLKVLRLTPGRYNVLNKIKNISLYPHNLIPDKKSHRDNILNMILND